MPSLFSSWHKREAFARRNVSVGYVRCFCRANELTALLWMSHSRPGSLARGNKALTVSAKRPEAVVIGADQVLTCDDQLFDKPGRRTGVSFALLAGSPCHPPRIWSMRQAGASFGHAHAAITAK